MDMFEYIPAKITTPDICVLGVLASDAGIEIKNEMLSWLLDGYNVIAVNQEPPGILFEYPALYCAQDISFRTHRPILYLHTKGAANQNAKYSQCNVRLLWKDEFLNHKKEYMNAVYTNNATVACPIISNKLKITWWNGFIANYAAWTHIGQIEPSENRFVFEQLFKNSDVNAYGRITSHYDSNKASEYSALNFINNYGNSDALKKFTEYWG